VGGVRGRTDAGSGRSNPLTARRLNGGRHPGPPDVVNLRGWSSKRGSWSVRLVCAGLFPCSWSHRRQVVPSGCRGGERRQHAQSARTLRGDAQKALFTLEDTSFARSRGPCTSIVTYSSDASRGGGAVGSVSRSGKPAQAGGTGTGVGTNGRMRGSPRVTASLTRRSCVTRQKRKGVMASVPARKRELRLVSVRRVSLQKSAGRVLAPNTLARSAPKRVAVRVNGGLIGEASGTKVSGTSSVKRPLVCRPSSVLPSGRHR